MPLPFFFHPEADAEFIEAVSYYGERSLVVGIEFIQLIDQKLYRLLQTLGWDFIIRFRAAI